MCPVQQVEATSTTELLTALPPLADLGKAVPYSYGGEERVLINDPQTLHQFMSIPTKREGRFLDINQRVMGEGLLVTNRLELWRPRRKVIQRELAPSKVVDFEPAIIERTERAIAGWIDRGRIAVRDEVGRLTLDNLGDAVFGGDFGGFRDTVQAALSLLVEVGDIMESGAEAPREVALLEDYVDRLEQVVNDLIDQRQQSSDAARDHVLDVLIRASDRDDPVFADPFVRDESITLMMAGHDTTAFLIAMTAYQLALHPEVKQRLADEVAVARAAELPPREFARALPYARQVASETLRLYPPVPFISRTSVDDVEVDGTLVPAGSVVTMSPWITHRSEEFFPDPLVFDPDRFGPERREQIPRNAYLPFGLGQRVCAGNHFAMLEAGIITSMIAADVELTFESTTPSIDSPVTLRFTEPLWATVERIEHGTTPTADTKADLR